MAQADRVIAYIEAGIATSTALAEGEARPLPESDDLIAQSVRNARAEQVWNEVVRILNDCTE